MAQLNSLQNAGAGPCKLLISNLHPNIAVGYIPRGTLYSLGFCLTVKRGTVSGPSFCMTGWKGAKSDKLWVFGCTALERAFEVFAG